MSAPQTIRSATRRLVALTVLRWLPVGLTTPITVLLAQSRGLSLAEIGVLFTVHGAVVVVLELPTGGLADVLGRRPVVVAGAVLYLLSCLVFATATSFPAFLAAILLLGLGRTLDSGPVEAWYVDTVHRIDPAADVAPGLARHSAADGGSLAVGRSSAGCCPHCWAA
jgi:MFS family permease